MIAGDLAAGRALRLAGNRPALDLQRAAIGVAAQLAAALDERRMQRRGADERVRAPGLQRAIERLEGAQHAAHAHDRVAAVARAAAVRGAAFRLHFHPLESLVRDRDLQFGGLGHDAGVGPPRAHERVGADARVFLVDDARHDDAAGGEAAGLGDDPGRADHRGHSAFHVL